MKTFFKFAGGLILTLILLAAGIFIWAWKSPPTLDVDLKNWNTGSLMSWDDYPDIANFVTPPILLERELGTGAVLFVGTTHTNDPSHPQYDLIPKAWAEFNPDVALIEGRLGFFLPGLMDPIEKFGESGLLAKYAKDNAADLYSWELSKADEITALKQKFTKEQVAMFIILRPYTAQSQDRRREGGDAFAQKYIDERGTRPGLDNVIRSVSDLDRIWARDFPEEQDWRTLSYSASMPGYIGELFEYGNDVRDYHLMTIVDSLTDKGHRVIVTAGWSHIIRLAQAYEYDPQNFAD